MNDLSTAKAPSAPEFLSGGGEMGALMRAHDWALSPLGSPETWPQSLRTVVGVMLGANQPMFVAWGPGHVMLYNDAYSEILAAKHPAALGRDFLDVWNEIRADLIQIVEEAYAGRPVHMDDIELLMHRKGYPEETHFAFSYTPVRDEAGAVAGFFCPCSEITGQVLAGRRQVFRIGLEERLRDVADPLEVIAAASAALGEQLGAGQVAYAEIDESGEYASIERDWNDGTMVSNAGRHRLEAFGPAFVTDLKRGQTIVIGDVSRDPRTSTPEALATFERASIAAFLDVPLIKAGRLVAVVAAHCANPRIWSAEDVGLVQEVAERTWSAVDWARATAELAARNRRLDLLAQIAGGLVLEKSPEERLQAAFADVAREVGANYYFNFLIDESDPTIMRLAASGGLSEAQQVAFAGIGVGEYLCGRVAAKRQPVVIEDLDKSGDPACAGVISLDGKSYAGFPLVADGRLIGTISFASIAQTRFTEDQVALMRTVADQAAAALDRRRAEAALREAGEQAAKEAAERSAILSQLAEGVIVADRDGSIIFVNEAATRLHGVKALDVAPSGYSDTYHLFREDGTPYPFEQLPLARAVMQGETVVDARWRIKRPNGTEVLAIGRAQPIRDDGGDQISAVLTVRDDTARFAAEQALRETEERFRLAARATNDAIWDWDFATHAVIWNEAVGTAFGHVDAARDGTSAQWWIEHIHPDDRARVDVRIHAVIDGAGETWADEYRFRRADGTYADVLDRGAVLRDAAGRPLRVIGAMQDLSERKRAEEALRQQGEEFHALAENVSQLAWMAEPDGSIFWYNKRWHDYTGTDLQAMQGRGLREVHHPEHIDRVIAEESANWARGEAWEGTYLLRSAEGEYRWFLTRAEPIRNTTGELVRWFGTNTDITAQFELERRQAFLLSLADRVSGLAEPREIAAVAVEMLGRHLGVSRVGFGEVLADGETITFETDYADGVAHLVGAFPTDNFGPGNFADLRRGLTTTYADLEADPRTAGVGFAAIEARSAMAVPLVRDGQLRAVLYLNHREIREWLPDEVVLVQDVAARTRDALERARAEGELRELNATLETRVAERTAELEQAHEALRQSQKMEAVGQLTGGIAHDFNNMLAVVIGSLDLLSRRIGVDDARAKRYVDAATEGARRAALLTQRLLAFSRQQPLKPEPIDANKLVTGMSDLLRGSLGGDIRLETVLAGGQWRINADPNQLENVLLNLAVNARDAMPEGGRLTIETQNTHLDARYTADNLGVPAGQYVMIAVTDTGEGMPPDVIAKAFDPFFTTKEVGKGTGLGLSQVYGFVKQSGGNVKIYSEAGQGTTVKIYLPRYMSADSNAIADDAEHDLPLGEREEVVLVVEDEPAVRQFSVDALGELGYRVLEADGAIAALRLLDAHPEIALLFTDVVMPDVNGRKLAEEALRRRPDLKVLFTTGYTRNAVVHNGVLDPGVELIGKPFTIEELASKVREVLDATAQSDKR